MRQGRLSGGLDWWSRKLSSALRRNWPLVKASGQWTQRKWEENSSKSSLFDRGRKGEDFAKLNGKILSKVFSLQFNSTNHLHCRCTPLTQSYEILFAWQYKSVPCCFLDFEVFTVTTIIFRDEIANHGRDYNTKINSDFRCWCKKLLRSNFGNDSKRVNILDFPE